MMKKTSIIVAAMFLMVFAVGIASAAGSTVQVVQKDGDPDWNIVPDGANGTFNVGPARALYSFSATGLECDTQYSLISYAEPYPGNLSKVFRNATTGPKGNVVIIPSTFSDDMLVFNVYASDAEGDYQDVTGAKIWLVKSCDLEFADGTASFVAWNPDDYLFETSLIEYVEPPELPVANFTTENWTVETGALVQFTDTSTGNPTNWTWKSGPYDIGQDIVSYEQNPSWTFSGATHTYYAVVLRVENDAGYDVVTKYVTVIPPPPTETPTPTPTATPTPTPTIPPTDCPVYGANVGVFRPATGQWFLDTTFSGAGHLVYMFGKNGDVGVTGDWNGDGKDEIGVVRYGSTWILDLDGNGAYSSSNDVIYTFGKSGDQYVVGDWNADGIDEIGVIRNSNTWILDASGDGKYGDGDYLLRFGTVGDTPVIGTWQFPI